MFWFMLLSIAARCQFSSLEPYLWMSAWHHRCELWISPPLSRTLLCGSPLQDDAGAMQNSALMHLLIGSGSHLLIWQRWFEKVGARQWRICQCLSAFLIVTMLGGLQAPALRSLLALGLRALSRRWKLAWSSATVTLYAGLICLLIFPGWARSLSLPLSWGAALIFSLLGPLRWKPLYQGMAFWLLSAPLLLPLSVAHPFSLLLGSINSLLVMGFFFPLAVGAVFSSHCAWLLEHCWSTLAQAMVVVVGDSTQSFEIHRLISWAYVLFLQLICQSLSLWRARPPKSTP